MWSVDWIEGDEALGVYQAEASGPNVRWQTIFQDPILVRAWFDTKGRALGVRPALAIFEGNGGRVLLPLATRRRALHLRASGVGDPHFDYQIPLVLGGPVAWPTFWFDALSSMSKRIRLADVLVRRIPMTFAGNTSIEDPDVETAQLELHGAGGLEDLLAQRGANLRSDVRRRLRRSEEMGGRLLRVFDVHEGNAAEAALVRLREAYEVLHAEEPSGQLFRQPGTMEFYRALLRSLLPTGRLHLCELLIAGEACAWHFGFLLDGVLHWYKPTYAKGMGAIGPGKLLLADLVSLGYRQGWRQIDFGGGLEPYKRQWGNRFEPLRMERFFGSSVAGWWLRRRHA